ncbi:MAG TPA: hypothetical protein VMP01_08625 [Pirellulaceae bacterium]|nr:hypothetical protein [Pirellulaceae bacterium]
MKTSSSWYVFFFLLGGIAMVTAQNMLFVKAADAEPFAAEDKQPVGPAINVKGDGTVTQLRADETVVERLKDGRVLQSVNVPTFHVEQRPDGSYVQRPVLTPDGGTVILGGGPAADPETAKLLQDEMQATQAAQKLWRDFHHADSDGDEEDKERIKTQLREKLTTIFDLQQKRRAGEVAKIEQRLAKLKATMSKRDAAKQEIVDRRLDMLTGGIDELGWEDTFRGPGANAADRVPSPNLYKPGPLAVPPATTVPRPAELPRFPVPSGATPADPAAAPAPADAAPPEIPRTRTGR